MKRDGLKRKSAAKALALITDKVGEMEKADRKAKRDEKKKIAAAKKSPRRHRFQEKDLVLKTARRAESPSSRQLRSIKLQRMVWGLDVWINHVFWVTLNQLMM